MTNLFSDASNLKLIYSLNLLMNLLNWQLLMNKKCFFFVLTNSYTKSSYFSILLLFTFVDYIIVEQFNFLMNVFNILSLY